MIELDPNNLDRTQPFALYLHLPFCHYRCHYCDFYASAGVSSSLRRQVIDRIHHEVIKQLTYLQITSLESVYFGGGTPSMIDNDQLHDLLRLVQTYHPKQVTIEVNPEDVTSIFLKSLNIENWQNIRISMGLQTFHQPSLDAVGRQVTIGQMHEALKLLTKYKSALNVDLIAGLPYHTQTIVESDMQKVLDYEPAHISLYALAMEEGTVLSYKEHPALPSEEDRTLQWQSSQTMLLKRGYQQYEISNYALNSAAQSLQNLHYWQLKPYLGIGPGAVGTLVMKDGSAMRISGRKEFSIWQNQRREDLWLYETIESQEFLFEHYMMSFRTSLGISKAILKERFGEKGLTPWYHLQKTPWSAYLQDEGDYITLTDRGRLFLDAILLELL